MKMPKFSDKNQLNPKQEQTWNRHPPEADDGDATTNPANGTITRRIVNPRLEIGDRSFSGDQIRCAEVHLHEGKSRRSASLMLNPPLEARWDYREEARVYEDADKVLTGICTEARVGEKGTIHLKFWGHFWRLERDVLQGIGSFGMSNKETFYWLVKLNGDTKDPIVEGLEIDSLMRPFLFAVPLKNITSPKQMLMLTADAGITSHEHDNSFRPILEQFEEIEEVPAWSEDNPKLFGVVFANDLLQAENAARHRAHLMVSMINLALRTGMSHFETRYASEPIGFDREAGLVPVSLQPWIIIREMSERKEWIRMIPVSKIEADNSLEDSLDRIKSFFSAFNRASEAGDIHDQMGKRQLTERERRLSLGMNRAMRWLNSALDEVDVRDQFTATWIALETILNAVRYPRVFDGERASLKEELRSAIRRLDLPRSNEEILAIKTDMLESRVLQDNWSTSRKLPIFAQALGIHLKQADKKLVSRLSRARNRILHEGEDSPDLSQVQLDQLRNLVERLIVGTSTGGYEDLEDITHTFHFGIIGPEGGAAPITIDGKEDVPYECVVTRDSSGQLVGEWIAEGKIYREKNIEIV